MRRQQHIGLNGIDRSMEAADQQVTR
jgi:hypothetical protein